MIQTQLIEGKKISEKIFDELTKQTSNIIKESLRPPCIAVVIIGDDDASHIYVNAKEKVATRIGFSSIKIALPSETTQQKIIKIINELNNDDTIDGILVQFPLPKHINEEQIISQINPNKDVDCFHPYNIGKILIGDKDGFAPCTPSGCIELLQRYQIKTTGKNVVIIGRSNIVGKPLAALLMQKGDYANATVTICHSQTQNIIEHTQKADIIISALGKPHFLKANMVKENVVVVDVGINRIQDTSKKSGYRLVGDADFEQLMGKCSWLTPVPGGVGPMTIAMLMQNTLRAFQNSLND